MGANKWLYANVHKQHHENKVPLALAAIYCHPLEFLVSDIFPLGFGMIAFNVHVYTGVVWTCYAVMVTQTHHSGVRWPWIDRLTAQPNFHDYHHEKFNVNYGAMGWLDDLHGTGWDWMREDTRFSRSMPATGAAKAAKAA